MKTTARRVAGLILMSGLVVGSLLNGCAAAPKGYRVHPDMYAKVTGAKRMIQE